MFLPDLLATVAVEGVASYPAEPVLAETDERGEIGGSRTESVTLVAEGGGSGEMPTVRLDWYNLETGEVETASVEGFAIAVDGPPARTATPRDWSPLALGALAALAAIFAGVWLLRRVAPPFGRALATQRAVRLASEDHAFRELRRAVDRRDNAALRPALDAWAGRVAGPDPRNDPRLRAALTSLGADLYGPGSPRDAEVAWQALEKTLAVVRDTSRSNDPVVSALPRLNPTG
jgi:hypothetical protein